MSERVAMFNEESGKYVNLPKIGGEPVTVTIKNYRRIEIPDHEKNFKSLNPPKNWGFHIIVDTDKGEFTLNTWKLYYLIKDSKIYEGDTIIISHPAHSEWGIKLVKNEQAVKSVDNLVKSVNGDLDYLNAINERNKQKVEINANVDSEW